MTRRQTKTKTARANQGRSYAAACLRDALPHGRLPAEAFFLAARTAASLCVKATLAGDAANALLWAEAHQLLSDRQQRALTW